MKKTFTVRDLPQTERPRERLAAQGPEALSLPEILALVLGRGIAGEPVMTIAQKLLSHFGSLQQIQEASLEEMQQIRGLGFAKACQVKACFEIARRLSIASPNPAKRNKTIVSPEDIFKLVRSKLAHNKKEHLLVISFDTRNKVIGVDTISIGTLNANLIHPRETFEAAIKRHAVSIIIVHNHPSGDPTPSDEDLKVTEKLVEAGKFLEIVLLDHIIVTKDNFYSFRGDNLF